MINLLPTLLQKTRQKAQQARAITWAGLFLAAVIGGGIIIMLPSFFRARFAIADLTYALRAEQQSPAGRTLDDIEVTLNNIERVANLALAETTGPVPADELLADLSMRIPSDVSLQQLRVHDSSVTMAGKYALRSSFLVFLEELRKSLFVEEVISPLTNLLQERDAAFSITLTLKGQ